MAKWSRYLDEDYEDQYEKVQRIKHKPKQEEEKKGTKKPSSPIHQEKK